MTSLDLRGKPVTNEDLAGLLQAHPNLLDINLYGARISDAGLANLAGLESLRYLNLARTGISDAGPGPLEKPDSAKGPDTQRKGHFRRWSRTPGRTQEPSETGFGRDRNHGCEAALPGGDAKTAMAFAFRKRNHRAGTCPHCRHGLAGVAQPVAYAHRRRCTGASRGARLASTP